MTFSALISGTIPHRNKYNTRPNGIASVNRVIQHHWASQFDGSAQASLGNPTRKASATYLVTSDGTILGQVPEEFRPWTSGGPAADNTAITIECQNSTGAPTWEISAAAEASIVRLLADIATRHASFDGKLTRTNYRGHREFASTACPGPYLYPRLGLIADKANLILGNDTSPAPTPIPTPTPPPAPSGLVVDGQWGDATTRRLQEVLGTPVDGVISHQWKSSANENIYSAQFDKTKAGSTLARAMQSRLGVGADGLFGSDSVKALQRHYGTPVDGVISPTSTVVKAMQNALNANTF